MFESTSQGLTEDLHTPEQFFREEYGRIDYALRANLVEQLGPDFAEHVHYIEQFGLTKLSGLFDPQQVAEMQSDAEKWISTKQYNKDNHMSFDGNSGEAYLLTSNALSSAVTHPTIISLVTTAFGQHPNMNFVRTYSIDPIEPYERRAFQWHHDGYSEIGLKVMILLSDVPKEGQAMAFCPATNRRDWQTESSRQTQFSKDFAQSFESYICAGQAGDVFIFNPHAVHKGTRNQTVRRNVIVANFQPGVARNYPLPGLHEAVVETLTNYEKAIFRTAGEQYTISEATFPDVLQHYRQKMTTLFGNHKVQTELIRSSLSQPDKAIAAAGSKNLQVFPEMPKYIDNPSPEDIQSLKQRIASFDEQRQVSRAAESDDYLENLKAQVTEQWHKDMHADLDLPIRMYHPDRDQRRDNAITQARDNDNVAHFTEFPEDLAALTTEDLITTHVTDYQGAIVPLLDLTNSWLSVFQEAGDRQSPEFKQLDSLTCFAEDLDTMLQRAYSSGHIRRDLMFAYMLYSRFGELYGTQSPTVSDFSLQGRKRTLALYTAITDLEGDFALANGS